MEKKQKTSTAMVREIHWGQARSVLRSEVRVGLGAVEGGGGDATDIGEKYYLSGEGKWEMGRGGRKCCGERTEEKHAGGRAAGLNGKKKYF